MVICVKFVSESVVFKLAIGSTSVHPRGNVIEESLFFILPSQGNVLEPHCAVSVVSTTRALISASSHILAVLA